MFFLKRFFPAVVLGLVSWLASAAPAFPDVSALTTREMLTRIKNLEQTCIANNDLLEQARITRFVRQRQNQYAMVLAERLRARAFPSVDLASLRKNPKTKKIVVKETDWKERSSWIENVLERSPSLDRCEMMELAWATALSRLQVLEPSRPICRYQDIMCWNRRDLSYQNDVARALFELRYFDLKLPETPRLSYERPAQSPCDEKAFIEEAQMRLNFLRHSPLPRRPLGYAVGMCGRSMTAHYLDDEVELRGGAGAPRGWDRYLTSGKDLDLIDKILKIEAGPSP